MKETGCDLDQAISALKIANGDFEKAIAIINTLLKYIVALKGKFMIEEQNIYGLFITIANIKLEIFLRHTVVVGYTPLIYQSNLQLDWRNFERNLYALRLSEGVDKELTRRLQNNLEDGIKTREDDLFYGCLENRDLKTTEDLLKNIIRNSFNPPEILSSAENRTALRPVKLSLQLEELSVAQFTEITEPDLAQGSQKLPSRIGDAIILKISLQPDEINGISVNALKEGVEVAVRITDQRDIAQYLSRLLSSETRNNPEEPFHFCPVGKIEEKDNGVIIYTRFGAKVMGITDPISNFRVKVANPREKV